MCDKVVCVCDNVGGDKVVGDKVGGDKVVCDKVGGDKVVCDTVVCDNWYVTKLCVCVTKLDVTKLCGSVEVREEEEVHAGYRSKNKNPTQFCGESNENCMYKFICNTGSKCCRCTVPISATS